MLSFASWLWLLAVFAPLVVLERYIHQHLQGLWLLVFRNPDIAAILYSILMLPGVLVHEFSHYLMATLLLARTGRFSVIPERQPDGTLRLGFVETEKTDVFREALIGAAPLLAGSGVILAISYFLLDIGPVAEALAIGDVALAVQNLGAVLAAPDAWLWVYLLFTVSNSMLPSASDRRAWLPVLTLIALVTAVLLYAGLGQMLANFIAGPLEASIRLLATAFTITVALNSCIAPLLYLLEQALMRLTGLKVEY